jgi:serralysin
MSGLVSMSAQEPMLAALTDSGAVGSAGPSGLVAIGHTGALTGLLYSTFYWSRSNLTFSIPGPGANWPSYAPASEPFAAGYRTLNDGQAANFRAAVERWDRLIAVTISETPDAAQPGDIRVAFSDASGLANFWGYAYTPPFEGGVARGREGDVWINSSNADDSFDPGAYDFQATLHELGHALGLKHPFDPPILASSDMYDTWRYTVMSYTAPAGINYVNFRQTAQGGLTYTLVPANPTTPMVLDIAAIQGRYGADPNTEKGDTVYRFDQSKPIMMSIYDAGGIDTFDLSNLTRGSSVDLRPGAYSSIAYYSAADQRADAIGRFGAFSTFINQVLSQPSYTWSENVGIAFATTIENVIGSPAGDSILGNDVANMLSGGGGDDRLSGGPGDDLLTGGSGSDLIDGGDGVDAAFFSGASNEYAWTWAAGVWTVRDLRASAPDGADTITATERLKFSDRTVVIGYDFSAALDDAFANILRAGPGHPSTFLVGAAVDARLTAGGSAAAAIADIIKGAAATTSVATLAYQFFTSKIPSAAGMDFLVSPTGPNQNNLNSAYYQSFSLENRYINFAVNLGKLGEGKDAFTASFGAKSLAEATRDAYATIFGAAPTEAKITALLTPTFVLNGITMSRAEYFAYYGQDGETGIGTKAAMVGWLLGEAVKADQGMYAKSNSAFLTDLSDGATFAVDLVGVYGKPDYVFTG